MAPSVLGIGRGRADRFAAGFFFAAIFFTAIARSFRCWDCVRVRQTLSARSGQVKPARLGCLDNPVAAPDHRAARWARRIRMNAPKVFIFAPADESGESHKKLQDQRCELILGKASWDTPQGSDEAEMASMAAGCDALVGTSIRSTPISRRIMRSSDRLRIVAKYTIGVDDVDVEAATELGILVTHSPTESNWGGVAEGTITNMLTLLKKVRERDHHLKTS